VRKRLAVYWSKRSPASHLLRAGPVSTRRACSGTPHPGHSTYGGAFFYRILLRERSRYAISTDWITCRRTKRRSLAVLISHTNTVNEILLYITAVLYIYSWRKYLCELLLYIFFFSIPLIFFIIYTFFYLKHFYTQRWFNWIKKKRYSTL